MRAAEAEPEPNGRSSGPKAFAEKRTPNWSGK
jgi:hypothetical protein